MPYRPNIYRGARAEAMNRFYAGSLVVLGVIAATIPFF
jgi:hypothetical protein